ncbi:MAG: hypothetical protein ABI847_13655, partial [Anaerolineales bacterium]
MPLSATLTHLETAGLIRLAAAAPDLAYAFRHGLMQDAAYSTLLRGQRQAWHQATAEILEAAYLAADASGGADAGALSPILAHHFTNAGDKPRALHYLVLSADAAFDRYANVEAIDFYSRALQIAQEPGAADRARLAYLFQRLGLALELTSQFQAALEHYQRQEALALKLGDQPLELASLTRRAIILSTANFVTNVEQAMDLLERARRLAHAIGDRAAEARISWTLLLNNTMAGGDVSERIEHGERALRLALSLGDRELLASIHMDLWYGYAGASRWQQALAALAAGEKISREIGNLPVLCETMTRSALSHLATGNYTAALAIMDEAYRVAEAANSADFRSLARAFTGLIHQDRGDFDQAIQVAEAAIAQGEISGNVTALIGTRSDLARAYALLGDLDHALSLAQQAHQVASTQFEVLIGWPLSALMHLHLLRGEVAQAAAIQSSAPDYRDLQRRLNFMAPMWINMALANIELALAQNQFEPAAAQSAELIQRLIDCGLTFRLPDARLRLGEALLRQGRLPEAQAALQAALQAAETLGSRRVLWPIFEAL